MTTLYCLHNWSQWIECPITPMGVEVVKIKLCTGLCRRSWSELDPEPKVALGTME